MSKHLATTQRILLCREEQPGRRTLESLVRDGYLQAYGARIYHYLPLLLGLAGDGEPEAVIGMAPRDRGTTARGHLLDSYLDKPCDELLEEKLGSAWDGTFCEIGNLYASERGQGINAIAAMAAYLEGREIRWAMFTATRSLRLLFRRLDLELCHLAPAAPARLGSKAAHWGTYYETNPEVVATRIPGRHSACMRRADISTALLEDAFQAGRSALEAHREGLRAVGA